jgi:hypothetical protein
MEEHESRGKNGPVLYRSWSGYDVHEFSYSMARDIADCGESTKYKRFEGLVPVIDSAALKFGIAAEEAIRSHYVDGRNLVEEFIERWKQHEHAPMNFTKNDASWTTLHAKGRAIMAEILRSKDRIPLGSNTQFNVDLALPGWYKGTTLTYKADALTYYDTEGELLIDTKTSSQSYPESNEAAGYPGLDPQLCVGSLVSSIRRVCFIVMVKTNIPKIQVHYGTVSDFALQKTDEWLKEQYDKLVERRLTMRPGFRYPDNHCTFCDYLLKCLGRHDEAARKLRHKQSDEVSSILESIDEAV